MPAAHTSLGRHVGRLGVLADSDHWRAGHPHSQTSSGFHPLYFPCLAKRGAPSPSQPAPIPILYPNIIKFRSGPGHGLAAATNPHCSVLISASSFNPAPSKRPPSLLVRPVWGPWPTGKLQVGSRTEVLILQPWSGLGQPPEASGVGGGHLLTHARASHKYCHCRWHHDPVLSPQHAPSHGQSNAYFSLYFLCLSLSSLARQGGGGVGAVPGEWGTVFSVPSQLSLSRSPPSLCLNTDCPAPGRPAMAPVQGQHQLADASTQMANSSPEAMCCGSLTQVHPCLWNRKLARPSPPRHRCSQVGVFSCE